MNAQAEKYILLVEDDPVQVKFFGQIIKKIADEFGLKSKSITSGEEFLNFIQEKEGALDITKNQVKLIILDLQLAADDISGFYILKKLQAKNNIPVLVQSADSNHTSIIQALKLGAEDYFIKGKDRKEGERMFDRIRELVS
ncbi:MAG: DNA-binding response OmpR family regulator [Rickettsiales bacterium]|jgi:DNA-binding response OmpR family regulator